MKYSSLSAISSSLSASSNSGLSVLAEAREHLVAHLADDLRARVEILVDAVAEAHQPDVVRPCPSRGRGTSGCCRPCRCPRASRARPRSRRRARGPTARRRRPRSPHTDWRPCCPPAARWTCSRSARGRRAGSNSRSSAWAATGSTTYSSAGHREEHVQHVRAVVEVVARVDERLAEHVLVAPRPRSSGSWRGCGARRSRGAAGYGCPSSRGRTPPSTRRPRTPSPSGARRSGSR